MSWFWKGDDGWEPYSEEDSERIEKAHQKSQKSLKLNDTYKIDLKAMIQFRMDDPDRQRDIKREEDEGNNNNNKKGVKRPKEDNDNAPNKKGKDDKPVAAGVGAKRLQRDYKISKEAEAKGDIGFSVELIDDDLYKWEIKLWEFAADSQLAKDLKQYNNKHGVNYITMRFYFPGEYPLKAPLVHIVTPKLVGPYIFQGGLCMNILMQGWAPGIVPEALVLQIRQLFMEGNVRINNINKVEQYTEQEARQGFHNVEAAHANDKSFE